jgi:hypothetical protein
MHALHCCGNATLLHCRCDNKGPRVNKFMAGESAMHRQTAMHQLSSGLAHSLLRKISLEAHPGAQTL